MNQHLIVLLLTVWLSAGCKNLNAQYRIQYGIGLKTGIGIARFVGNQLTNTNIPAYQIGLSVDQRYSEQIALGYDLVYTRQGNLNLANNPGLFDGVRTRLDYLQLPVTLRLQLGKTRVYASPGIQFGYLLAHRIEFLPPLGYTNPSQPFLKKSDMSVNLGIAYRFTNRFLSEIRYNRSLSSIYKEFASIDPQTGQLIRFSSVNVYNQLIAFSLIYSPFQIK